MTALYHRDPYQKDAECDVEGAFQEDDGRFCITLTDPIFYPQGGGQKGDRGEIHFQNGQVAKVIDTIKDKFSSDGRPLIILDTDIKDVTKGAHISSVLDWPFRIKQMRLHSLVHLHHCMMERRLGMKIPNPAMSDLGPSGAAVNRYETNVVTEELAQAAVSDTAKAIAQGAPIITRSDETKPGFRYWESMEFTIPCGGTHLANISEIGLFTAEVSRKKGRVKIDFVLAG